MDKYKFQREYERLCLPLGMYALRITESVDDAEDAVQTAFINVWNKVAEGLEIENFKQYMYAAVRNCALTIVRNRSNYAPTEAAADVSAEEIDTSERDARIWRTVDALPERRRTILLMSKRDGMTNAQIAEELCISIKTVENQMTKALSALREHSDLKILTFL